MTYTRVNGVAQGRGLLYATLVAIFFISTLMFYVQMTIEQQYRTTLQATLTSILEDANSSIELWYKERENDIGIWVSHPELVAGTKELLRQPVNQQALVSSPAQKKIRKLLRPVLEARGFQGFFIISPDFINLGSTRDSNIGVESLLVSQRYFMEKVLHGDTAISLPQPSDVPLFDENGKNRKIRPTMFVGAPIEDENGDVIALLTFRINPEKLFYKIIQQGRVGNTGETYAFNSDGIMLNHSRFDDQLREIGLLSPEQVSALNVHIRDHGHTLQKGEGPYKDPKLLPLTKMAAFATSGKNGIDIDGYRDYRGVQVVGAWRWNGRQGFGLVTEQDYAEAYASLIRFRYVSGGATLIMVLMLSVLSIVLHRGNMKVAEGAQRFKAVFDHVVDGLITINEHGIVESMNPTAEKLFGYEASEVVGKNVKMLMPERYAIHHDRYLKKYLRTGKAHIIGQSRELEGRRKDGSEFPLELGVSIMHGQEQNLYLGSISDITLRKKAEEELRASEASLANAQSIAKLGSWHLNLKTNELKWSDEIYRIFGLRPQEFGASYEAFIERVHPEDRELVQESVDKSLQSGAPYKLEHRIVHPDGSLRYVMEQGGITYDTQGNPEAMTGIVQDITEQKKVDRMKSEFVSTVSHELRTPLTSIYGSLGLLVGGAAGEFSGQAKSLLEIAYKSADRLIRLINDILDAEKLEADRMTFNMQRHDVVALIEKAIVANQAYAEQFDVGYVLKTDLEDTIIFVDTDRFEQVMANLMSNAAKFSPKGEDVVVSIERQAGNIRVSVTDKGPGIPEEFKGRLFQKFAQADSSDTRKISGTGLGLNIFKKLVERMGGTVGFDSTAGKGSTFFFIIPELTERVSDVDGTTTSPNGTTVLICEDDPDVAHLLKLMLLQEKIETDIAYNVAEAKEHLSKRTYDAMTLDLVLPDMDGITFLRELRADPETRSLPVVVVSAKAEEGKEELNGDAFGIIDWLTKPLNAESLKTAIHQATQLPTKGRTKILHVEDDEDIVQVVSVLLKDVADIHGEPTLKGAKERIEKENFDLVILDMDLPDGSGIDLLSRLESKNGKTTPVLVFSADDISSEISEAVAAALVKSKTSNDKLVDTIKAMISRQAD